MKTNKILSLLIISINVIGAIFLIYFAIPYFTHDTAVAHPDAMLPAEAWDQAGMTLTIGFFPLVIINAVGYLFFKPKSQYVRLLFFLPSILCLITVVNYWIQSIN